MVGGKRNGQNSPRRQQAQLAPPARSPFSPSAQLATPSSSGPREAAAAGPASQPSLRARQHPAPLASPARRSRPRAFLLRLLPLPSDPTCQPLLATVSSSSPRRHRLRPRPDQSDRRGPGVTRITLPCPLGAASTQPPRQPPTPAMPFDANGASPAVRHWSLELWL